MNRAETLAPTAALASMTTSRPKVLHLARQAEVAGLLWAKDVMDELDGLIQEGRTRIEASMNPRDRDALATLLTKAATRAKPDWERLRRGSPAIREQAPRLQAAAGDNPDRGLTASSRAGVFPGSGHLRAEPTALGAEMTAHMATSMHLQREISLLENVRRLDVAARKWVDVDDRAARRIQELLDPSVSHSWLWSVGLSKVPDERGRLCDGHWLETGS